MTQYVCDRCRKVTHQNDMKSICIRDFNPYDKYGEFFTDNEICKDCLEDLNRLLKCPPAMPA